MKKYLLQNSVGICLFDNRKCGVMTALAGAGILGSVTSLIQSGVSMASGLSQAGLQYKAQKEANETNVALNEATNQANKDIANEVNLTQMQIHQDDMNFNREEAQKQREWDSAAAQRQRLVDAGYNPLMLGNGAFGSSGSPASAPAAPSLDVATLNPSKVSPVSFDGLEAIGQAMGLFDKAQGVRSKVLENAIKPEMFASELEYKEALIRNISENTKILQENLKWLPKQNLMRWRLDNIQRKIAKQQYKEMQETFEFRKKQLEWLPKISEKQWDSLDASIAHTRKEVEQMDANMLVLEAQKNKILAETQTINELRPEQIASLRESVLASRIRTSLGVLDIPPQFRDSFFKCLSGLNFDTSGFQHLSGTNWYREPNEYVKALLYAAGLLKGKISIDDALRGFGTSNDVAP